MECLTWKTIGYHTQKDGFGETRCVGEGGTALSLSQAGIHKLVIMIHLFDLRQVQQVEILEDLLDNINLTKLS